MLELAFFLLFIFVAYYIYRAFKLFVWANPKTKIKTTTSYNIPGVLSLYGALFFLLAGHYLAGGLFAILFVIISMISVEFR